MINSIFQNSHLFGIGDREDLPNIVEVRVILWNEINKVPRVEGEPQIL